MANKLVVEHCEFSLGLLHKKDWVVETEEAFTISDVVIITKPEYEQMKKALGDAEWLKIVNNPDIVKCVRRK